MGKVKEEGREFVILGDRHEGRTRSIVKLSELKMATISAVDWSQQLHKYTYPTEFTCSKCDKKV